MAELCKLLSQKHFKRRLEETPGVFLWRRFATALPQIDHNQVPDLRSWLRSMDISLTRELEKVVKTKVRSGMYQDASEVVREALRLTFAREQENEWLAREAALGFAQLEAGQTVTVESKEQFIALVREEP